MDATRGRGGARIAAFFAAVVFALALPATAAAFHTDGREGSYACEDCHASFSGGSDESSPGVGPHGLYRTDTRKCGLCHRIHNAPVGSIKLLPASTIEGACFTCHDSTGADGVYSGIVARGGFVAGDHSIGTTSDIPGGSFDLSRNLTCISCHTVHRATTMEAFPRTNGAALAPEAPLWTDSLLRDDVGEKPRGTFTRYGGEWCAGCHDQRMSAAGPAVMNHPTDESVAYAINRFTDPGNANFITTVTPPYCQQCHNNAMDVESPNTYEGLPANNTMNPQFGFFPHQTTNTSLLVETDDDLCTNCHDPASLP